MTDNSSSTPPSPIDYSSHVTSGGTFWTQSVALFLDAYRDLNSKKMFWVTLVISFLVVIAFAFVGVNDRGFTLFGTQVNSLLNTSLFSRSEFYKFIFVEYGLGWWVTWIATILAIVSTAGIFPDLISGGAIDLYLSKPISRLRLFMTKYLAALLFVALQAAVFSFGSFLLIGIRGGAWEPGLFLAVPVVVLFYSYIFAICVLLGVLFRSTVSAMLLTLLIWLGLCLLQVSQNFSHQLLLAGETQQRDFDAVIAMHESQIDAQRHRPPTTLTASLIAPHQLLLDKARQDRTEAVSSLSSVRLFDRITTGLMMVMPKTQETVGLLKTKLIAAAHLEDLAANSAEGREERRQERDDRRSERTGKPPPEVPGMLMLMGDSRVVRQKVVEEHKQSGVYIVGTSLAFEALVLVLAAWVFCRRDY